MRTADGMATILELEQSLDAVLASEPGPSSHAEALDATLSSYIGLGDLSSDSDADGEADTDSEGMPVDGITGDKRKLFVQICNAVLKMLMRPSPFTRNGIIDTRIRKRPRLAPPHSPHTVELWWDAQSSDAFLANSLPPLPSLSASGPPPPAPRQEEQQQSTSSATAPKQQQQQQQRRKKKRPRQQKPAQPRPRSLLAMMNANITTQRRMRRTHAKFVALGAATSAANNSSNNNAGAGAEDADGAEVPTVTLGGDVDGSEDAEVIAVDERPWPVPRPTRKETLQEGFVDPSPDIGERAAEKCMQWVNRKILEHIGFQGAFSSSCL